MPQFQPLKAPNKVPLFYLPSASGGESGPASTRSKYNLVLAFLENGPQTEPYLRSLADVYPSVLQNDGRVIAVVDASLQETQQIASSLSLPFTLLADNKGTTTTRILGEGNHAALCVADRYGIIYFGEAAPSVADLPAASILQEWLEYVEIQCPECTDGADQRWLAPDPALER